MPAVTILVFRERNTSLPVLDWLDGLAQKPREKALEKLEQLAAEGHDLRRPISAPLRDGIHELRVTYQNQQNRILYFFDGQGVVILAHGLKKEAKVPDKAIELALARRAIYRFDPEAHSAEVEF